MLRHLVAVAAVSGSLLTPASAAPAAPSDEVPPNPPLTMPCFKEPARWNDALDGPSPHSRRTNRSPRSGSTAAFPCPD